MKEGEQTEGEDVEVALALQDGGGAVAQELALRLDRSVEHPPRLAIHKVERRDRRMMRHLHGKKQERAGL